MDGTSTASTGNVLQCLTTRSEEFLPIIQSKLILVHFEATIPCPITVKSPPPDFFRFPSLVKGGSERLVKDYPRAFSSPDSATSTLSAFPDRGGVPPT